MKKVIPVRREKGERTMTYAELQELSSWAIFELLDNMTDDEVSGGKRALEAAEKVAFERYPNGDTGLVIAELLENGFVYDYKDYKGYLTDADDVQYCAQALVIRAAQDVIADADAMRRIIQ